MWQYRLKFNQKKFINVHHKMSIKSTVKVIKLRSMIQYNIKYYSYSYPNNSVRITENISHLFFEQKIKPICISLTNAQKKTNKNNFDFRVVIFVIN